MKVNLFKATTLNTVVIVILFFSPITFANTLSGVLKWGAKTVSGALASTAVEKTLFADEKKESSKQNTKKKKTTKKKKNQRVSLDNGKLYSLEEQTVGTLHCSNTRIQFARGMRWTPADFSPVLSFDDNDITLDAGCYSEMSCVEYKGVDSLLLVVTACGGNAVGDEYHVFNLKNQKEQILDYRQAKKFIQPFSG